jgi:hypothetical protein
MCIYGRLDRLSAPPSLLLFAIKSNAMMRENKCKGQSTKDVLMAASAPSFPVEGRIRFDLVATLRYLQKEK